MERDDAVDLLEDEIDQARASNQEWIRLSLEVAVSLRDRLRPTTTWDESDSVLAARRAGATRGGYVAPQLVPTVVQVQTTEVPQSQPEFVRVQVLPDPGETQAMIDAQREDMRRHQERRQASLEAALDTVRNAGREEK